MREVPIQFGLALLAFATLSTVAQAGTFTLTSEAVVPNAVVGTYDPANGNLSYDGNGFLIPTMELISSASLFDTSKVNEDVISGPFDVFTSAKFFKLVTNGIESVDIGPVLPSGLTAAVLLMDMQVDGSKKPPGGGPYLFVVPEPSTSLALIGCGVLGLQRLRRKQSPVNSYETLAGWGKTNGISVHTSSRGNTRCCCRSPVRRM